MARDSSVYPLKFKPRLVEKIWGGRKLESVLNKALPAGQQIGESWEIYDFPPGVLDSSREWVSSRIENGPMAGWSLHEAVQELGADLYGSAPLLGDTGQFPLLIKFLDAREDLSVQVHPDLSYARANPSAHLKTEAWYVLQSDPGSRLLKGLMPGTDKASFERAIRERDVERFIQAIAVNPGDCFYLPSGTVHALGAGILAAEVQTPSDTTFRVFDFNRVDPSIGATRTLHVEQALACIDFSSQAQGLAKPDSEALLVDSPFFRLHQRNLSAGEARELVRGAPLILIMAGGDSFVETPGTQTRLAKGEVVLIPAALKKTTIRATSETRWLEVELPE